MISLKHRSKAAFLTLTSICALSAAITHTIQLPVKNASIYVKQRALFAKTMAQGLMKYAKGELDQYTEIESKLAQLYGSLEAPSQESIKKAVESLYNAIQNNPLISIEPGQFLRGASCSAYQNEGGLDNNSAAARFYAKKGLPLAGDAINFYNNFDDIIEQMSNELNINAYRISLAWNRIEPEQGVFDYEAIAFYRDILNTLLKQGIKPMVVFHHYDIPTWFEDLGGFELEENGKIFQNFCLTVYTELAEELGKCLISMCNAPEGPAFKGYFTGDGTPGEIHNLPKTHTVIANMYYELVDTALHIQQKYAELKKINSQLQRPSIGTQINVVLIDPMHNWKDKLSSAFGCTMGAYVQSGGTYNFLVNGEYCMYTPDVGFMKEARGVNVYRYHPNAYKAFDWIGVNIYSNIFVKGTKKVPNHELIEEDEERYTDNPNYRNYPEGIYRAVQMIFDNVAMPLGKLKNKNGKPLPIIVTENGIATKDDAKRTRYYQRALATITQLIKDGYPVVGYLPWTSHDNYEWPTETIPQAFGSRNYGFFKVNFDKNSPDYLKCTLKEGSRYFADFNKAFFELA